MKITVHNMRMIADIQQYLILPYKAGITSNNIAKEQSGEKVHQ